jgi:hypothetical protein
MRDEVPVGVVRDLGAEGALAQGAVAVHVKYPQAYVANQQVEHAAGIPSGVVLEDDRRPVLSQESHSSLQGFELCPFDVELDQRRHIVRRQSIVESANLHLEQFDLLGVVAGDVEAAARVGREDPGESPRAAHARQRRLSHVDLRKRVAQLSSAVRKRLEGDMAPVRRVPNHVLQQTAGVGADVDTVGIGPKGQRKHETQCLIVAHRAPGLSRSDRTLDRAQLWLQPCTPGEPQDLAAGGNHNFERVTDISLL